MAQIIKKNYTSLASFYGVMMKNIDYSLWAEYLVAIAAKYTLPVTTILEIGSGNGKLAKFLIRKFPNYFLSDKSFLLLAESKAKKNKICCDMSSLPFTQHFDFVFAAFDTVNYLTSKANFKKLLTEAASVLIDGGIFTFDVSLEKNSLPHEKGKRNSYLYKTMNIEHLSIYNTKRRIHTNEFTFFKEGKIVAKEIHKQKIFPFEFYLKEIDKSSFYIVDCLEAFGFNKGKAASKRVQFILKKVKEDAYS